MQKLFNNILVPVNFSLNSIQLLKKGADFAAQYGCSIHLLYVINNGWLGNKSFIERSIFTEDNDNYDGVEPEGLLKELCSHLNSLKKIMRPPLIQFPVAVGMKRLQH